MENVSDTELAWGALQANSGTANHADEAKHIAQLHYDKKIPQKEISKKLGKGFSIATVCSRLKLFDKLEMVIFEMLREGMISPTTAYECTRLSKSDQIKLLESLDADQKLTPQIVKEFYREIQSNQMSLFSEEQELELDISGLFVPGELAQKLFDGIVIEINFKGNTLEIQRIGKNYE